MSISSEYRRQVELLLDVLPYVNEFPCFAIKGGTAINLFIQNMPRLSVDIDLTYLLIESRDKFLTNLTTALNQLAERLAQSSFKVEKKYTHKTKQLFKLLVFNDEVNIKIEPNMVLRGSVFDVENRVLSKLVQEEFLESQSAQILSVADLYGGKICAALDRQHPRDLFDIKLLFENGGITDQIRQAFVVYLASSPRPMSELLSPNELDMRNIYEKEFLGMTNYSVSYEELHNTRSQLIINIQQSLTDNERNFLLSIKQGNPAWDLLPIDGIGHLPGLQWKLVNIKKMDSKLHKAALDKLRKVLSI